MMWGFRGGFTKLWVPLKELDGVHFSGMGLGFPEVSVTILGVPIRGILRSPYFGKLQCLPASPDYRQHGESNGKNIENEAELLLFITVLTRST